MAESIGHTLDAIAGRVTDRRRWEEIDRQLEGQIADCRVLVVGAEVSDDAAAFAHRRAGYVLACSQSSADHSVPPDLRGVAGVDFRLVEWRELDPALHGSYDIVHCHGLLHRVAEPVALLNKLRAMSAPGATLLIGSMILDDAERSEYLRFVPHRDAGDSSWWFVPGRLAFRWLVNAAGFDVETEFAQQEGPRERFPVVATYLKATARA